MVKLRTLLNKPIIRKIFGKKEIEIIKKQLDGIALTQSEQNRLSRDIRMKFRAIAELNRAQDQFGLKKNQDNMAMISQTIKVIREDEWRDDIQAILLFGSLVDNSVTSRSDIDICVLFQEHISLQDATRFRIRISGKVPDKMDIQVFNVLPQKIKREIGRRHRVLYSKGTFDNVAFSLTHLKEEDFFLRTKKISGET